MSSTATPAPAEPAEVIYPESDGKPLADNMKQARWIVQLYTGLVGMFVQARDVLVCMNIFWYPVRGVPSIVNAPDVLVAFGRPKEGDRSSYKQWEEADVPPQVVFEVTSPGNSREEMVEKFHFYDDHGVQEYYVYDPDKVHLEVYTRAKATLVPRHPPADGWVSPLLKIRFDLTGDEMVVYRPDGRRFLTAEEIEIRERETTDRLRQADDRAQQATDRAQQETDRAQQATDRAQQAADRAQQAERHAARLAELSRKARRGLASPDELLELDRLEESAAP